ncbi:hypothetical protein RRG08_001166 [Elysia crispata]|uniref:Uncharacterized protein n=1 Tax=Elysia crispata TaxID=231223 RepID=A0AAE1A514_9GAST|nr:hypothetical protein RRG08_001166 [Elysia crispata]
MAGHMTCLEDQPGQSRKMAGHMTCLEDQPEHSRKVAGQLYGRAGNLLTDYSQVWQCGPRQVSYRDYRTGWR